MEYYQDRIIAFIDVLGFKNHIHRSINKNDNEIKKNTKKIYSLLIDAQKEYNDKKSNYTYNEIKSNIRCNHFSDSIVISCSINEDSGVFHIFSYILFICVSALRKGFLFRGAITKGKLYHEDNLIFGPALVTAAIMEKELAVFPRIIIENNVILLLKEHLRIHLNKSELFNFNKKLFNIDFDGLYYINYINGINYIVGEEVEIKEYFKSLEKYIIELKKTKMDLKLKSKYLWLKEKYNKALTKYKRKYSRNNWKIKFPELSEHIENREYIKDMNDP